MNSQESPNVPLVYRKNCWSSINVSRSYLFHRREKTEFNKKKTNPSPDQILGIYKMRLKVGRENLLPFPTNLEC